MPDGSRVCSAIALEAALKALPEQPTVAVLRKVAHGLAREWGLWVYVRGVELQILQNPAGEVLARVPGKVRSISDW